MNRALLVAGGLASSACSILYNPNNIDKERVDAARPDGDTDSDADIIVDAASIDMLIDVPPGQLTVDATEPPMVDEGTGNGGSRNALVLLDVRYLEPGTPVITIDPIMDDGMMKPVQIVSTMIATDRSQIALELKIPILAQTNEGATKAFTIHVEQPGNAANFAETTVQIVGLDQFAPAAGTIDTSTLKSKYSSITFNGNVHFVGSAPAYLRSTTSIAINAIVDVNAIGTTPGASGCAGGIGTILTDGTTPSSGGCGAGGGLAGASGNSSDGGGGGYGSVGLRSSGGNGGAVTGEATIVALGQPAGQAGNRGNGGGGGGALLGGGGNGGGGGGAIEITAAGTLTIGTNGRVQANGGTGTAGALNTGGGGGGSGGAIIIRAQTITQNVTQWAVANGGNGGSDTPTLHRGGAGRIRIDTNTVDIASMTQAPAAVRGVVWTDGTPTLVSSLMPELRLFGTNNATYGISKNGAATSGVQANEAGQVNPSVTLSRGINKLCGTVGAAVQIGQVSSTRCVDIIYVP